jgi:hypothetical protein
MVMKSPGLKPIEVQNARCGSTFNPFQEWYLRELPLGRDIRTCKAHLFNRIGPPQVRNQKGPSIELGAL